MQLSLTLLLGLVAATSAGVVNTGRARTVPREAVLMSRQNGNRPAPSGTCCVANTNLKQDACTSASGQAGRCVPGGNNCTTARYYGSLGVFYLLTWIKKKRAGGGALSCVEQSNLVCDANVVERGNTLCRAKAPGGGLFDGANIIQNLSQATVN